MKPEGQGARGLAWHHTNCFMELSPTTQVEKLSGWNTLPGSDQAAVLALFEKVPSSKKVYHFFSLAGYFMSLAYNPILTMCFYLALR